jgi:hypothetical protein
MKEGSMTSDELDRILSGESHIDPSPGFTSEVMRAVRRDAIAPSRIPFPWKRALPGLTAGAFALIALVAAVVRTAGRGASAAATHGSLVGNLARAAGAANAYGVRWILLALLLTLACLMSSTRLTTGSWRAVWIGLGVLR